MYNTLLKLSYKGTIYHGWQLQKNQSSIQGATEKALERLFNSKTRIYASGRTDAGVHATAQYANFFHQKDIPLHNIVKALNSLLPEDIRVCSAINVDDTFNARRAARGKRYLYIADYSMIANPISGPYTAVLHKVPNFDKIREAMPLILGTRDFSSFRASGCASKSPVREIKRFDLYLISNRYAVFVIEATAFLKQMVRNIMGSIFDVGFGKYEPENISRIIKTHNRSAAGPTAKAKGLFLMGAYYPALGIVPDNYLSLLDFYIP